MKWSYYLFIFLFALVFSATVFALTPEEILLLKRSGVSDEKILEMQKKEGGASPRPDAIPPINAFDWNEDGKKDIIAGSDSGQVYVYFNNGTNSQPIFDRPVKIPGAEVMRLSDPYIADWNSDGKKDVIVGQSSGEVSVFINNGSNQSPLFAGEIKLNDGALDVGQYSSLSMVDWNADGKKDLLIGNSRGNVYIFFNMGDAAFPRFSDNGIKTPISVSGYATPFVADWNGDGKFDVICGSSDGKVYIFINEGNDKNPAFGKSQTLQVNNKDLRLPSHTAAIPFDWDDDGKIDLLVSNKKVVEQIGGRTEEIQLGVFILMNTGTKEKPEFKELKPVKGKFRDDTVL
ncbi:MAG: VCBS repeat-containing protein [Nitrospirota bacterium]